MKGVFFDDLHSFNDFRLILSSKSIETPKIKTIEVEIDGSDGVVDLTDYFGEPKYGNRIIELNFSSIVPIAEFLEQFSEINNAIHGKKMKIVLDDDPDFYYVGRCSVSGWKWNGRVTELTIECNCEPYKYKMNKTIRTDNVSEGVVVNYSNLRKRVVPTFTTDNPISFKFNNVTFTISAAGNYVFPEVTFEPGANRIEYLGAAKVTVEYLEGGL